MRLQHFIPIILNNGICWIVARGATNHLRTLDSFCDFLGMNGLDFTYGGATAPDPLELLPAE